MQREVLLEAHQPMIYVCSCHLDCGSFWPQGIERKLRKLCRNLDDVQREVLLEATFAMATADGVMAVRCRQNHLRRLSAAHSTPWGGWCEAKRHDGGRFAKAGAQCSVASHTVCLPVKRCQYSTWDLPLPSQDAEVDVLGRVALALNVPPTVVELKIFEWKVRDRRVDTWHCMTECMSLRLAHGMPRRVTLLHRLQQPPVRD